MLQRVLVYTVDVCIFLRNRNKHLFRCLPLDLYQLANLHTLSVFFLYNGPGFEKTQHCLAWGWRHMGEWAPGFFC